MVNNEKVEDVHQLSVPAGGIRDYHISEKLHNKQMWIVVEGALLPLCYENLSSHSMEIWMQHLITHEVPQQRSDVDLKPSSIHQIKVTINIYIKVIFLKKKLFLENQSVLRHKSNFFV